MSLITEFQASRAVAKQFEEKGYLVTLEPSPSLIPFDLDNYRPDLLAAKPGVESVLVEVKQSDRPIDRDRFIRIAKLVEQHPGWTFKLVTVPPQLSVTSVVRVADIRQIPKTLEKVDQLLATPGLESMAIIPLWNAYVAVLQHLLSDQYDSEAVTHRSDLGLLNLGYSMGALSIEEFELAKSMLYLRNRVAHELAIEVPVEQVLTFRKYLGHVIGVDQRSQSSSRE